jgi:adenylate cyclase
VNESTQEVSLLLADISGSTPLYEEIGDSSAFNLVGACLDGLKEVLLAHDGVFISSKGDDVLGTFANASNALKTARAMLLQQADSPLDIHVGIHSGHIINFRGDVYGDTVNMAARLASLAKSGEILASGSFVDQLPSEEKRWFHALESITLKGKSASTRLYTLLEHGETERTRVVSIGISSHSDSQPPQSRKSVTLEYDGAEYRCTERKSLIIGRADECDLVIGKPWISRHHARINPRHGRIEFEDQSSSGTYVVTQDGFEFFLHRDNVLLTGSGIISPAVKPDADEAEIIRYQVY